MTGNAPLFRRGVCVPGPAFDCGFRTLRTSARLLMWGWARWMLGRHGHCWPLESSHTTSCARRDKPYPKAWMLLLYRILCPLVWRLPRWRYTWPICSLVGETRCISLLQDLGEPALVWGFVNNKGKLVQTYLSGPMTGIPEFNHPAFHAKAAELRALGVDVLNPAEHDAECGTDMPWAFYLRRDLVLLAEQCDRIVLLPGWENSKGARLEVHVGKELGMEIVYPAGSASKTFTNKTLTAPVSA